MQLSKKRLAAVLAVFGLLCVTVTYAYTAYYHNVLTTFTIQSSYNIRVVDSISGENWSSWSLGTKYRADFPAGSGSKNVTWMGDAPNAIYLWWNTTGFHSNVTVTCEQQFNGGGWSAWESGFENKLTMGPAYPMRQVRFSISVFSTIPDGSYTGTIYLNADPK